MKRGFYRKFAIDCIRKNKRMYIPYMLTCILMVTLFYIIQALSTNSNLDTVYGDEAIRYMLKIGTGLMIIFSSIFLFYTNSFLTKQRKHEFGIYNVLGLEKRHIARIIMHETVIVGIVSLICGILAGILLYKLAYVGLLRLMNADIPLGFEISNSSVVYTIIFFAVIYLVLFLNAFRQIRFSNTIALLQGSSVGEKEPRSKWFLAILGIVSIAIGYGISVSITNPLAAFGLFFLAVLFVAAGTYLLFMAGSIIWLKALRKNKKFYYKANHFINISNMIYRMKQNAASLASICILSTMVIIAISTTLSLYVGTDNVMKTRYPREINLEALLRTENYSDEYFEKAHTLLNDIAEEENVSISNEIYVTELGLGAQQEGDTFATDVSGTSVKINSICSLIFTTADDYGRLTGSQPSLDKNEIMVYSNQGDLYPYDTLSVMNETFTVSETLDDFPEQAAFSANAGMNVYYIVVDSMDTLLHLYDLQKSVYGDSASSIDYYCGFNISDVSKSESIIQKFEDRYKATENLFAQKAGSKLEDGSELLIIDADTRSGNRGSFLSLYGSMFFIGIFLSIIFLIATVLIIYYKQISEGLQDAKRYEIMQNVGLSKTNIKKYIRSQVLMVFFLPLVVSGIHSAFAFPIVSRLLSVLAMGNSKYFIYCLIGTFAGFALLYIIIYLITAKSYYKIVSK